jgi:hypothetical protein
MVTTRSHRAGAEGEGDGDGVEGEGDSSSDRRESYFLRRESLLGRRHLLANASFSKDVLLFADQVREIAAMPLQLDYY